MPSPTIYNQPAQPIAQFFGGQGTQTYAPTYAATMALDLINNAGAIINGVNATSATVTLTAAVGPALMETVVLIKDTGGVTATFSTGFKSAGTVNPTTGKAIAVFFISDGTNWIETGRNAAAVTY